ncbi:hypothetical protein FPT19_00875 [Erysipelothrix rhusiopathiae]|uniref:hypothetical protein n=1 Tax=Erysipelothrix rhusiopathiae TaxID=1648 RepID=UPI000CA0C484|nr:hypothetical protein [Erysipelothrix rhusiopathiae]ASD51060.1 hypothetical protein SER90K_3 [Erysipelothrix phage phi1605]QDS38411.1 hypothetical protein FPT19_00875 [Erysipelothrix rhusiopathiae]
MNDEHSEKIAANTVESLVEYFGDNPIFLLRTYTDEEYVNQAEKGIFYANSVKWFRNNGNKGRGDPNESVIPNFYYGSFNINESPQINNMKMLFNLENIEKKDAQIKKYSLVCFYGIFLEDCIVARLNTGDDILYIETKEYFKDFGRYACVYEFSDVEKAVREFKKEYKDVDFGKITYMPVLEDIETRNEKKEIDGLYIDNLIKRYKKPYFFKDLIYSYQKEWRIFYPYEFVDGEKRFISLDLEGQKKGFEKNVIESIDDKKSMYVGFLAATLIPNYKSPFNDLLT